MFLNGVNRLRQTLHREDACQGFEKQDPQNGHNRHDQEISDAYFDHFFFLLLAALLAASLARPFLRAASCLRVAIGFPPFLPVRALLDSGSHFPDDRDFVADKLRDQNAQCHDDKKYEKIFDSPAFEKHGGLPFSGNNFYAKI